MTKLHELTGQIINKELHKVYNKKSPYLGNICYKLTVINDKNQEGWVFVYPNLVTKSVFQTIEQSRYIDKRYLFFCENSLGELFSEVSFLPLCKSCYFW